MNKRKKLESKVDFYSVGPEGRDGPTYYNYEGSVQALFSAGASPYDAGVSDKSPIDTLEGNSSGGNARVFCATKIPDAIEKGDHMRIDGRADRIFVITYIDRRGVLPGRYPYRLEGIGN